jgi:hypothetical protein
MSIYILTSVAGHYSTLYFSLVGQAHADWIEESREDTDYARPYLKSPAADIDSWKPLISGPCVSTVWYTRNVAHPHDPLEVMITFNFCGYMMRSATYFIYKIRLGDPVILYSGLFSYMLRAVETL